MFSIRVLPPHQCNVDGQRLGEISIGDFAEQFTCYPIFGSVDELECIWRAELRKLIDGAASVALAYDPRFAWIIYREGQHCFVQQVFARDGDFCNHLASRCTVTEEGHSVSEWDTDVSAIARWLNGCSRETATSV